MPRNEVVVAARRCALSVVVPVFEEEASVAVLVGRLARVLDDLGYEAGEIARLRASGTI